MKSLLKLKKYFALYKRTLLLGIVFILLSNISGVFIPLIIKDSINLLKTNFNKDTLINYALLITGIALFSGFFRVMIRQTIIVTSRKIEFDLRNDFWSHLQKLNMSYYTNNKTGDIMALVSNDINAVRNFVGPAVMYTIDTVTIFILTVGLMLTISTWLTLVSLVPFIILSFIVYNIGKKIHARFTAIQEHFGVLTATAQENLSGIRIIKSYVRELSEIKKFKELSREYLEKNLKLARIQSMFYPLMFLVIGTSTIFIMWLGGIMVMKSSLSLGDVIAFILYLEYLIWPAIAFGWVTNIIQQAAASQKRLNKVLELIPEISDDENTEKNKTSIEGNINFVNAGFSYRDNLPKVLNNISLQIPAGSSLAIIGKTGTGKTTLINTILRLYDVTEGKIEIDGLDIKKIPIEVLRKNIGYVSQETFLFSDSLKANIEFGLEQTNEQKLLEAIDTAHLKPEIDKFSEGINTVIGERGITLSGGQKQRVSLARALIKDPSILILDDCFSAVDTYTEEEIIKKLKIIMKDRTTILISHRISTVKNADKIIVLDEGTIAESGTHNELVELNGIYAEMNNRQLLEEELEKIG